MAIMNPKFDKMLVERSSDQFDFGYRSASNFKDGQDTEFIDYAIYITKGLGFNTKIRFNVEDNYEVYVEVNPNFGHKESVDNVINQPMESTSLSGHYKQAEDVRAYFMKWIHDWMDKTLDFTIKIRDTFGRNADNKENAKSCLKQLIHLVRDEYGLNLYRSSTGTCHCGAFFGDELNAPNIAQGAMELAVDNIDKLGLPKPGFICGAGIGFNNDPRCRYGIHCSTDPSWVADQLSAFSTNHETNDESGQNCCAKWYGSISPP